MGCGSSGPDAAQPVSAAGVELEEKAEPSKPAPKCEGCDRPAAHGGDFKFCCRSCPKFAQTGQGRRHGPKCGATTTDGAAVARQNHGEQADTFYQLLEKEAVAFVRADWLKESFIKEGKPLVRRQDVPKAARVSKADSLKALKEEPRSIAIVSHSWMHFENPDPQCLRRGDLEALFKTGGGQDVEYVFWDFLSLFQIGRKGESGRTPEQQWLFFYALNSMHLVYSHPDVVVFRLMFVHPESFNNKLYADRGWCHFETCVACLGSKDLYSFDGSKGDGEPATPVPAIPEDFDKEIETKKFTGKGDVKTVKVMYKDIWETINKKDTPFTALRWGDAEVERFRRVLPKMPRLEVVKLYDCTAAEALLDELKKDLEGREKPGFLMTC